MFARRHLIVLFAAVALALAPAAADARAGGSSMGRGASSYGSMGSRGSQTFGSSMGAAPITRSMTPNTPSPGYGSPGYGYGSSGYGYGSHPFVSGLFGGLTGAWLGSMLFGGGYGYGGMGHFGGGLGSIFFLVILFFVGRAIWRSFGGMVGGRGPAYDPRPQFYSAQPPQYFAVGGGSQAAPQIGHAPLAVGDEDFAAFGEVLTGVQASWSEGNLEHMRRFVTPEMLSYFADIEADNASRGVANKVQNVTLLKGEPRDSWREGSVDYASTYLRWSAVDYTYRLDLQPSQPGYLVDGNPTQPSIAEEIWTFRRAQGGRWLLSAIQQTA